MKRATRNRGCELTVTDHDFPRNAIGQKMEKSKDSKECMGVSDAAAKKRVERGLGPPAQHSTSTAQRRNGKTGCPRLAVGRVWATRGATGFGDWDRKGRGTHPSTASVHPSIANTLRSAVPQGLNALHTEPYQMQKSLQKQRGVRF